MIEEWKECLESYEVSNIGNIRRKLKNGEYKYINGCLNCGYKSFDVKRKRFLVHHHVARLFIGERPEGLVIDHIDRNKLNNNMTNLRYITIAENNFNTNRVKTHIPQDAPNRNSLVKREYYINHKSHLDNLRKEYVKKNDGFRNHLKEYSNQYYENNKDERHLQNKEKKECNVCHKLLTKVNMSRHYKSHLPK